MYTFENGVAYRFNACIKAHGKSDSFIAVVADRKMNDRRVSFIKPHDILVEVPDVFAGREVVRVSIDGRDYTASAALPLDIGASVELLAQLRANRD